MKMWQMMVKWQDAGLGVMVSGGNAAGVLKVNAGQYAYLMEVSV